MRILLDMDGVVVDFVGPWLKQYNELTNEGVKLSDINDVKTSKFVGDPFTLKKLKDSPGFIRNLPPMPGAVEGITELHKQGHQIGFVSNGTNCPTSVHEKREWLWFYFHRLWRKAPLFTALPELKKWVHGDVLLEDTPKNLEGLEQGCVPLLYHHKYNTFEERFERIYDWSHFVQWVKENS